MLKITYTNGDVQNIKVTGDFFTMTLAPKDGKQIKLTPTQKAEALALDLASTRYPVGSSLSSIALFYKEDSNPKVKIFKPLDEPEVEEKTLSGSSFIKELKAMKKEWKYKKHTQHWKWVF